MKVLTDQEYADLQKRVAQGKAFLTGKWGAKDFETKQWVTTWFTLSNQLFQEDRRRGVFSNSFTQEQITAMQEATLERVRKQMLAKGFIKPTVERRTRKYAQSGSESHPLFESS